MLDITDLAEGITLAEYQRQARVCVEDVASRGKLPIVVGGSGLYTRALLDGYLPPQIEIPDQIRNMVREMPLEQALERLQQVDSAAWERIDRCNPRRVARALELALANGGPVAAPTASPPEGWRSLRLILEPRREILLERVQNRTLGMWEGWLEEVDQLERKGLASWLEQRRPIGYEVVRAHLRGEVNRVEAIEQIVAQTMALAKKQRTWLRKEKERGKAQSWVLESSSDWARLPREALQSVDAFLTDRS